MRKFLVVLLSTLFVFSGCKAKNSNILRIGIIQFVDHEALNASREGFLKGLKENGFEEGKNIEIDYKNASADQANCDAIASGFVSENKDLILAIATPAAMAAARATSKIPILVTAVTNPEASELVVSNDKPGKNVTGTSDLSPIEKQISLIKEINKNAKNVGILYSSGEVNSKYQADVAVKECEKLGFTPRILTFSNSSEISQVIENAKNKIDVIFVPTDNMVASNFETIVNSKIPVICSDINLVSRGAAGTYGIDYFVLGKMTAKQASEILNGKNRPENMPIEYLKDVKKVLKDNV